MGLTCCWKSRPLALLIPAAKGHGHEVGPQGTELAESHDGALKEQHGARQFQITLKTHVLQIHFVGIRNNPCLANLGEHGSVSQKQTQNNRRPASASERLLFAGRRLFWVYFGDTDPCSPRFAEHVFLWALALQQCPNPSDSRHHDRSVPVRAQAAPPSVGHVYGVEPIDVHGAAIPCGGVMLERGSGVGGFGPRFLREGRGPILYGVGCACRFQSLHFSFQVELL